MPDNKVNLVYYLGAGASANALPVAKDIPDRMNRLADEIMTDPSYRIHSTAHPRQVPILCKDMKWLSSELVAADLTIDELAKDYYLVQNNSDLQRLKKALSVFFLIEQARSPADRRYKRFFRHMLGRDTARQLAMPTDIRVISWNYDQQFERAFAEFFPQACPVGGDLNSRLMAVEHNAEKRDAGGKLQVTSEPIDDVFSICKLNGSAGVRLIDPKTQRYNPDAYVFNDPENDRRDALSSATHFYEQIAHEGHEPELRFAWESASRRDDALKRIEKFAHVDTVVVIGYSFSLFNRDLDREILGMLKPKRVYVQVAGDDAAVTDRLLGLGTDRACIDPVHDQDQFHIPSTYSPTVRMSRSTRERT